MYFLYNDLRICRMFGLFFQYPVALTEIKYLSISLNMQNDFPVRNGNFFKKKLAYIVNNCIFKENSSFNAALFPSLSSLTTRESNLNSSRRISSYDNAGHQKARKWL